MKLKSLLSVLVLSASFLVTSAASAFDLNDIRSEWDRFRINNGLDQVAPTWNGIAFGVYNATTQTAIPGKDLLHGVSGQTYTAPAASGTLELLAVHAEAATDTLTAAQLYGGVIVNTGAVGAAVYTLPAPVVGMHFRVYLTVAQDVDINPANGTQILALTNATGDAISSAATIGNCIELVALSTTTWAAFAVSGNWTDVN